MGFCGAVSRILGNLGVSGSNPLLERFGSPVALPEPGLGGKTGGHPASENRRCLDGLYLTVPTEWDDPYRFFRW
jgi:hypothetical protein